jgi:hypothetical protein
VESAPLIWNNVAQASRLTGSVYRENLAGETPALHSPFHAFLGWSDWLHVRVKRTDGIALLRLMELLFEFLTKEPRLDAKLVAGTLWRDYKRGGRHDKPGFMKNFLSAEAPLLPSPKAKSTLPRRQARHLV